MSHSQIENLAIAYAAVLVQYQTARMEKESRTVLRARKAAVELAYDRLQSAALRKAEQNAGLVE